MGAEWSAAELEALDLLQGHTMWINTGPVVPYEPYKVHWEEPYLPIAERETYVPVPAGGCPKACLYGECRAPGTYEGCGGCCACLRGCFLVDEQRSTAPYVWSGDSA